MVTTSPSKIFLVLSFNFMGTSTNAVEYFPAHNSELKGVPLEIEAMIVSPTVAFKPPDPPVPLERIVNVIPIIR